MESITRDHRDLAIEGYAIGELELLDRIADLESDCATYRDLVRSMLAASTDLIRQRDRYRDLARRTMNEAA